MATGHDEGLTAFGPVVRGGGAPPTGRAALVERVRAALEAGRSVLLVGPEGVGRAGIARAAAGRSPIVEVRAWALDAGGEGGRLQVDGLVEAVAAAGAVVGIAQPGWLVGLTGGVGLWTRLGPAWRSGRVRLLVRATPDELARLGRLPELLDGFERIDVDPLGGDALDAVVAEAGEAHGLGLDAATRDAVVALSGRFLAHRAQPGAALDLVERVADYQAQKVAVGEPEAVTPAFVERVVAIYTGLPRFVVSRAEGFDEASTRAWLDERLVGQPEATDALVGLLARFQAGGLDPQRPLGSLLLVGPPGVGRSTAARLLAERALGSARRLVEVDLGDPSSRAALLGEPRDPDAPTPTADRLRREPWQVLRIEGLDEAPEAARAAVCDLVDTGRLPVAVGAPIDLRTSFVVASSGAGAGALVERMERLGRPPADARALLLDGVARRHPPSEVGHFDAVVPLLPLDAGHARQIVRARLDGALRAAGLAVPAGTLRVEDEAVDVVVHAGFAPATGARGLDRELQRRLVMPVATALLEGTLAPGEVLVVSAREGHVRVRRGDGAALPVPTVGERTEDVSSADLAAALQLAQADLAEAALKVDEAGLRERAAELRRAPSDPGAPPQAAWRAQEQLDRVLGALDRLERLRARHAALDHDRAEVLTRAERVALAGRIDLLREHVADAVRELTQLGPDGAPAALVEVRPGPGGAAARDLVVHAYLAWARERAFEVVWLREPTGPEEPAHLGVRGPFAVGLLKLEAGLHRRVAGTSVSECRVRVGAWVERPGPVSIGEERALKAVGVYGGKVRSRVACEGGLVLQNERTLAGNRDLAIEVARAWSQAPTADEVVVRRYDLGAHLVRDGVLGELPCPAEALAPGALHTILCARVDRLGEGPRVA